MTEETIKAEIAEHEAAAQQLNAQATEIQNGIQQRIGAVLGLRALLAKLEAPKPDPPETEQAMHQRGEPDRALAVATQALRATQGVGIPLTVPLVDNTPLGSFWVRTGISIPVTGISVPIHLTRTPSAFIVVDNNTNAVIYRTGPDKALANPNQIVLRSSVSATVVSLLVG